ncbi:MAG: tetratricopeptide repeat protein, partial [Pyrinomonadaceae bacterium]
MPDDITTVDLRAGWWRRALLLLPVLLALTGVWYAARWCVANTVAVWAPDPAAAQAATRIAPDDPLTHLALAELGARSLLPEQLPAAVRQYELAASLSPNDYRLWLKLGRARSLAGDPDGAEAAFRRAVELAPTYADPRWFLGNHLLRQGREAEGFAELQRAAEGNPARYRAQVIDAAWQLYEGDVESVLRAMGDDASTRAALVDFMLARGRLDDALRLWRGLTSRALGDGAEAVGDLGGRLQRALFAGKRFQDVLEMERDLAAARADGEGGTKQLPQAESVLNGGFEGPVGPPGKSFFGWQVVTQPQSQLNLDERQRRGGGRSLRVVFDAPDPLDFRSVSQFVVVEPRTRYRLEFYARTEGLQTVSAPVAEVLDAADPARPLATSAALPQGTSDWQLAALNFATGPETQAVTIRFNREPCPAPVCPIFGKVWYDDFTLQRLGGDNGRSARIRRDGEAGGSPAERAAGRSWRSAVGAHGRQPLRRSHALPRAHSLDARLR